MAADPRQQQPRLSAADRARYRRRRIRAFSLTWIAYALFYVCRKNFSVVKNRLAARTGASNAQLGDIDTGYLTVYSVGQFINGSIGDRTGGKTLAACGLLATAAVNAGFAAGSALGWFFALWTLNGLAQAAGWPGTTKAFSEWFARDERGTLMGFWCTCYQVGPLVATVLATWLLVRLGWRASFFGPALLVGGYGVVFALVHRRAPADDGLPGVEQYRAMIGEQAGGVEEVAASAEEPPPTLTGLLRSRLLWTLGLTYVVLKFVRYTLLFWLPLYMAQQLGYGEGAAGYTSTAFDIAGVAGAAFAGFVSDRYCASRRAPVVAVMMALLAVCTYFYGAISAMGWWPNVIGIALMGFLLYGPDSVVSGVAAVDTGRGRAAFAVGFVNGLGSIGGALSGVVVGRLSATYGWEAVFSLFTPMCVVGALLMATLWRHEQR